MRSAPPTSRSSRSSATWWDADDAHPCAPALRARRAARRAAAAGRMGPGGAAAVAHLPAGSGAGPDHLELRPVPEPRPAGATPAGQLRLLDRGARQRAAPGDHHEPAAQADPALVGAWRRVRGGGPRHPAGAAAHRADRAAAGRPRGRLRRAHRGHHGRDRHGRARVRGPRPGPVAAAVAVAYALLWEGAVVGVAPSASSLSVRGYAEGVLASILDRGGGPVLDARLGPVSATVLALAVTVLALALARRRLGRMDMP